MTSKKYWVKVLEEVRKERRLFENRAMTDDKFIREQRSYLNECERRAISAIASFNRKEVIYG